MHKPGDEEGPEQVRQLADLGAFLEAEDAVGEEVGWAGHLSLLDFVPEDPGLPICISMKRTGCAGKGK